MYKNLKEKQREQEKNLVRLSRELESYEEWDIDKESQWVGRKMQFFQILDESNNTLRQKSDYIQKTFFGTYSIWDTRRDFDSGILF